MSTSPAFTSARRYVHHPRNLPSPTLPVNSTGMSMHVRRDWSSTLPPPPGCSDADDEEEEGRVHVTNYPPREPAGRSLLILRRT